MHAARCKAVLQLVYATGELCCPPHLATGYSTGTSCKEEPASHISLLLQHHLPTTRSCTVSSCWNRGTSSGASFTTHVWSAGIQSHGLNQNTSAQLIGCCKCLQGLNTCWVVSEGEAHALGFHSCHSSSGLHLNAHSIPLLHCGVDCAGAAPIERQPPPSGGSG